MKRVIDHIVYDTDASSCLGTFESDGGPGVGKVLSKLFQTRSGHYFTVSHKGIEDTPFSLEPVSAKLATDLLGLGTGPTIRLADATEKKRTFRLTSFLDQRITNAAHALNLPVSRWLTRAAEEKLARDNG